MSSYDRIERDHFEHQEPTEHPPLVNSALPPQLDLITTRGSRASASAQGNGATNSDVDESNHDTFTQRAMIQSLSSCTLSDWTDYDSDSDCDMSIIDGDEGVEESRIAIDEIVAICRSRDLVQDLVHLGILPAIDQYESPIATPMITSSVLVEPDSGDQSMRSSMTRSSRSSGSISPAGHALLEHVSAWCEAGRRAKTESFMTRPLCLIPEERCQHRPVLANSSRTN